MKLPEAWDQVAKLIRKLDPANDIKHLCTELRAKGWIVVIDIRPVPPTDLNPQTALIRNNQLICTNCGMSFDSIGCKACPNCGTTQGGCG